ncbi:HPP family protein, partial [Lysinibacillus xylanilyticus]
MADSIRLQDEEEKSKPIKAYIFKMKGGGHAPSRTNFADAITGAIGGLICISVLLWLTNYTG